MKERFFVVLDKSCNPDHLLKRFQLAGINFLKPYKGGYIFEYDSDIIQNATTVRARAGTRNRC